MPKLVARPYQQAILDATWDKASVALFLKQGLGKTKVLLDTAECLYNDGKIRGAVVVSKRTVCGNWELEEIPKHLDNVRVFNYRQDKVVQWAFERPEHHSYQGAKPQMRILLISDGQLRTSHGLKYVEKFLTLVGKALLVVDESTIIKNPTARITKTCLYLSKLTEQIPYRRIMCGEPAPQGPADLFSQYTFLDPNILGIRSFVSYKHAYCEESQTYIGSGRKIDTPTGRWAEGMETLFDTKVAPYTVKLRKEDALPDLPPKQYVVCKFEMNPAARKIYEKLQNEYFTDFVTKSGTGEITATLALSRAIRLHQIASDYVKGDDGVTHYHESGKFDVLMDILRERPPGSKTIIWAHYRATIDGIEKRLHALGIGSAVVYGGMSECDRTTALTRFQTTSDCNILIANPATAGWGLTLIEADTAIYYANSYNFEHRDQSEDRIHRIGQTATAVTYYDLVATDTVDELILDCLRRKADFSKTLLQSISHVFAPK